MNPKKAATKLKRFRGRVYSDPLIARIKDFAKAMAGGYTVFMVIDFGETGFRPGIVYKLHRVKVDCSGKSMKVALRFAAGSCCF